MNRTVLLGRTTKDIDLKKTPNGKSVASFTLAVNRRFAKDNADFIPCVAWDKTAEFLATYVGKGQMIAVAGELQIREYTDKNDQKRTVAEVIVDEVRFAGDNKKTNDVPTGPVLYTIDGNEIDANNYQAIADDEDLPF